MEHAVVAMPGRVIMDAFVVPSHGAAPRLGTLPEPVPGPADVLLDVEACGLNFADLLMADGRYQIRPDPPFALGMEVCGRIRAAGADVDDTRIGTRVAAFAGHGGLASRVVVPGAACVPVPDDMPSETAAGFLVAYSTSEVALNHKARLRAAERLVVLGAAGGVGLTAVELGAHAGAEVVAVARGDDRLAVARDHGAAHVLDGRRDDLRDAIRALGGADVVYDAVGGAAFDAAFGATNPGGRILVVGFASGEVPRVKANHLLVKNVTSWACGGAG